MTSFVSRPSTGSCRIWRSNPPVVIPLIVLRVLEIPHHATGSRIQGHRTIQIQAVIADTTLPGRMLEQTGVIGLSGAKEREPQLWIITAGGPDRATSSMFRPRTIPAVVADLSRLRNAVKAPCLPARGGIQPDDESSSRGSAATSLHHLAASHEGSATHPPDLRIRNRLIPHYSAALGVERHHMGIRSPEIQQVRIKRDVSLHARGNTVR